MAVECCGKRRTTKFCPECGKPMVQPKPIDTLLAHLNVRLAAAAAKAEAEDAKPRQANVVAKYEGWIAAIKELQEAAG